MNTCVNEETLSAYCDGVLEVTEQNSVEQHLQNCWRCRRVESDFRALSSGIHNLPELEAPAELKRNLIARLKAESGSRNFRQRLGSKWLRTSAAAVLILALSAPGYVLYFNNSSTGDQSMALSAPKAAANQTLATMDQAVAGRQEANKSGGYSTQQQESMTTTDSTAASGPASVRVSDRTAAVELYAADVSKAGQMVLRLALLEFPDISVKSFASYDKSVSIVLDVPGQRIQSFLVRLKAVGEVQTVNSKGNIADTDGSMELVINISSLK